MAKENCSNCLFLEMTYKNGGWMCKFREEIIKEIDDDLCPFWLGWKNINGNPELRGHHYLGELTL